MRKLALIILIVALFMGVIAGPSTVSADGGDDEITPSLIWQVDNGGFVYPYLSTQMYSVSGAAFCGASC